MAAAKNVAAAFTIKSYTITATAGGGGSISPSGTVSVNYGGSQSFTITPNADYTIGSVVVDGVSAGAVTSYSFTNVTGNHSITVNFTAVQQNSLNVTKAGTGSGVITSSPAGISCGADCSEVYTAGTVVTLTATPDGNSSFAGWSGACTGSGACTVTMAAAKNVAAAFTIKSYTITATAGGGGSISPSGTVSVNYGGSQSFTITPNADYTIGSVVVDGVSAGAVTSYSFTNVTGNHSITVNFTAVQQNSLNVTKAGTGSGVITSSPAGISCGADCSEVYTAGTVVTLTATPDGNSSFAGWSGACTGSGACTVTMAAAKNVAAAFTIKSYTITATAGGGGSISPSGTVSVNYGGSQSFTITPNADYTIGSVVVDGVSAGAVTSYSFTNVTGNHSITVNFTAVQQNSLNVTKAGTGSGVITSSPAGISCGADCSEVYTAGTVVTLTATPDGNSSFAGWSGACTGSGACTVTMAAAKNVAAAFTIKSYTITATAGGGGSISPSGTVSVNYGGSQSFTITPNADYTIGSVVVDGVSAGAVTSYSFTNVTGNHSITVNFTAVQQNSLNVTKAGTGSGVITSSPAGISCGADCSEVYTAGTVVTLTATPDGNSSFAGWSGACTGSGACTVTMAAAKNVAAAFTIKSYTITATAGGGGSISPSGTVSVNYGGSQSFTITPNADYTIGSVVVDGVSAGAVTSYSFTNVTGNHSITVNFTAVQQNSLNVTKAGTGSGVITSSPAGISCGADCSEVYTAGTVVTLTATPDGNSSFAGWSGACTGSGACTVTMAAAKNVAAAFTIKSYTITATAGGGGSISPSGTVSVNYGGSQSFTITPNADYTIGSVVVDGVSAGAVTSYSFTNVTGNHSITVNFTAVQQNSLNVTKAGTGSGVITSSPAGISCGADCSEVYTAGTVVTLTATPDGNSSFAGWSGACTGSGACTVTMAAAKNVAAAFTIKSYTITATAGGGGSISPSGTVSVNYGGSQSFTITPNADYTIGSVVVDGVSAGAVTSYSFTNVTGNHSITVNFTAVQQNSLNVTKAGTGSGVITSSPAGISCGADCSEVYTAGTVVTLTATPDGNSSFAGWSGACTGSGACTVTMAAAKNVAAAFTIKSYTITATAGGGGSISPSGTVSVNYGGSQSFTITPNADYTIGSVVVDGVSAGAVTSYSFTNVTGNHSITVNFTHTNNINDTGTNLPKTGQTTSYALGDDGNIQAGVAWPAQRFTDNGNGTVTDSLTGLMWLKDGGCMKAKWQSALTAVADLNNHQLQNNCAGYTGNYSDWRIPTMNELKSLINYGSADSAQWLDSEGFVNVKSTDYWSSTSYLGSATKAWMINMIFGTERVGSRKSAYILAVRITASDDLPKFGQAVIYTPADEGAIPERIEWPTPRFTDNGDGTVTDSLTNLMWLKDGGCLKKRWNDTLNILIDFNINPQRYPCSEYSANYSDWRLPNVKELGSMVNYVVSDSSGWLNSMGFTNVKSSSYWSSTTSQRSGAQAWIINMQKSRKLLKSKNANSYAWPVRGGNVYDN